MSEEFFEDRKEKKRERKIASRKDRSKFKKTDLEKREPIFKEKLRKKIGDRQLQRGRVLSIASEEIDVEYEHTIFKCVLKGSLKEEFRKIKNLVVVGDFVFFDAETCAIYFIDERKSFLSRRSSLHREKEQLIASNIDIVLITVSVTSPPLNPALIDQYIIATRKGGMEPVIVLNKIDLLEKNRELTPLIQEITAIYANLNIPIIPLSAETGIGLDALREIMADKASVFVGESGVGKTSLINKILGLNLATQEVTEKIQRGTHTTTKAQLIALSFGGWCIDTPGIQKFGLWDLKREDLEIYFPEISQLKEKCRFFDCTHTHEPDCAVKIALSENKISKLRFDSYINLSNLD